MAKNIWSLGRWEYNMHTIKLAVASLVIIAVAGCVSNNGADQPPSIPLHLLDYAQDAVDKASACSGISAHGMSWSILEEDPVGEEHSWPVILYQGDPTCKVVAYTFCYPHKATTVMAKNTNAEQIAQILQHEYLHALVNGKMQIKIWHPIEYKKCAVNWSGGLKGEEPFCSDVPTFSRENGLFVSVVLPPICEEK